MHFWEVDAYEEGAARLNRTTWEAVRWGVWVYVSSQSKKAPKNPSDLLALPWDNRRRTSAGSRPNSPEEIAALRAETQRLSQYLSPEHGQRTK